MAELLPMANYPAVRAALDLGLSTHDLPDATIELPIYKGAAERDVKAIDPDAESRTGDELEKAQNAAIYFCAARLAPSVVRLTSLSVQTRDVSYQKQTFDPEEKAAELIRRAKEEMGLDVPELGKMAFSTGVV